MASEPIEVTEADAQLLVDKLNAFSEQLTAAELAILKSYFSEPEQDDVQGHVYGNARGYRSSQYWSHVGSAGMSGMAYNDRFFQRQNCFVVSRTVRGAWTITSR